ncbi:MAG: hypothetical protein ACREMF_10615 [Gemmatimonadales bacterium]
MNNGAAGVVSAGARPCVALCVVHGIGMQRKDWADEFVATVRRVVARRHPEIDVYPLVVWWAPVTQRYEDKLIARHRSGLSWNRLRRLVIGFGGDVVAYQSPSERDAPLSRTYRAVHARIDRRLRALRGLLEQTAAVGPGVPVPLVVVTHSLGSVIFSDFTYDLQEREGPGGFAHHYGLTLRALYTAGSPLALYAMRYPRLSFDRPITLDGGTWINVLYKADVIAYPLRSASPAYAAVTEDWTLSARWWPPLVYVTPFAHLAYWNDRRVIRRVAETVSRAALE